MTAKAIHQARDHADLAGIASAIVAGLFLLFVAGVSQASVLHEAAHDQRHAIAFPCH